MPAPLVRLKEGQTAKLTVVNDLQKIEQIPTIIQTGGKFGMVTMNQSLVELYKKQKISYQEAVNRSTDPEDLKKLLQKSLSVAS